MFKIIKETELAEFCKENKWESDFLVVEAAKDFVFVYYKFSKKVLDEIREIITNYKEKYIVGISDCSDETKNNLLEGITREGVFNSRIECLEFCDLPFAIKLFTQNSDSIKTKDVLPTLLKKFEAKTFYQAAKKVVKADVRAVNKMYCMIVWKKNVVFRSLSKFCKAMGNDYYDFYWCIERDISCDNCIIYIYTL